MNIYLLQSIGKWISMIVVSIASFFHLSVYEKEILESDNIEQNKAYTVVNQIITHDTETVYSSKLPYNKERILVKGIDGIIYYDEEEHQTKVIREMVTEVIELGTGRYGDFTGKLTGYGPDCPGCSAVGNVACHTKNGGKHSLITDGIYYQDEEYGTVRIVAASSSGFECGTIVQISGDTLEPTYAVVLDRGSTMNYAWNDGIVWLDLAFSSQEEARTSNITNHAVSYSVERWGW